LLNANAVRSNPLPKSIQKRSSRGLRVRPKAAFARFLRVKALLATEFIGKAGTAKTVLKVF